MSRAPTRLRLWLGPTATILASPGTGLGRAPLVVRLPGVAGPDTLPAVVEPLKGFLHRARLLEIRLSNAYLRYVLTPPPQRLLTRAEEGALVAAAFRRVYGEAADGFRIRVVSQSPDAGCLGVALEEAFAQALERALEPLGVRRCTVRPIWGDAIGRPPRGTTGWHALAEPGWLSLLLVEDGVIRHVSGHPGAPETADPLPAALAYAERVLARPIPRTVTLRLVGPRPARPPALPSGWTLHPPMPRRAGATGACDFYPRRRRDPGLGPLLLVVGLAALGGLGLRLRAVARAHAALPPIHADAAGATRTPADRPRGVKLRAVRRRLRTAWQPVFTALEQATPPKVVALRSVRCTGVPGTLGITAEARTLPAALHYVARLNDAPAFADVLLRQYRVVRTEAGHPVRFTLTGRVVR